MQQFSSVKLSSMETSRFRGRNDISAQNFDYSRIFVVIKRLTHHTGKHELHKKGLNIMISRDKNLTLALISH